MPKPGTKQAARREPSDLTHIHPDLRPFAVPLATLTLDPANARLHDERNLQAIMDSLSEHGQLKNIVVQRRADDGTPMLVRGGNGTCLALTRMGKTHVAALVVDMNDVDAIKFALRDNRTAELASWDYAEVSASLRRLQDEGVVLTAIGWNEAEYGPLLAATFTPPGTGPLEDPATQTGLKVNPVKLTADQRVIFEQACARLREGEQDPEIPEGRCLELICADYLAGA